MEDTNNILNVTLQITLSQIIDMVKQHDFTCEKKLCRYQHIRRCLLYILIICILTCSLSRLLPIISNVLQDERNQILTAYLWIRQVWLDAHLKWNKDDYDGLDTIRIPSSYVWRPDIVLYNK